MPFPRYAPSSATSSGGVAVASNNVKYTDPTATTVNSIPANQSAIFFRWFPKVTGEVLISVDATSSASVFLTAFFPNAQNSGVSSGNTMQGASSPLITTSTPIGSIISFLVTGQQPNQGSSATLATINGALATYTAVFTVFRKMPIFIGVGTIGAGANATLQNLRISYDIVK
jgi:hypothetical protein